jgi:hypothetical protein
LIWSVPLVVVFVKSQFVILKLAILVFKKSREALILKSAAYVPALTLSVPVTLTLVLEVLNQVLAPLPAVQFVCVPFPVRVTQYPVLVMFVYEKSSVPVTFENVTLLGHALPFTTFERVTVTVFTPPPPPEYGYWFPDPSLYKNS